MKTSNVRRGFYLSIFLLFISYPVALLLVFGPVGNFHWDSNGWREMYNRDFFSIASLTIVFLILNSIFVYRKKYDSDFKKGLKYGYILLLIPIVWTISILTDSNFRDTYFKANVTQSGITESL